MYRYKLLSFKYTIYLKLMNGQHVNVILTYSMVRSPSWEANWFAASQEIPCISRNPKVHYRTHKRPPPVSILGQPHPVHIPTSHHLEIHQNNIDTSTPRSPQWPPSLRFPHQEPLHPPLPTHTCHMPSPSHMLLLSELFKFYSAELRILWIRIPICETKKIIFCVQSLNERRRKTRCCGLGLQMNPTPQTSYRVSDVSSTIQITK